ncbi:MAG: SDR family NAD(P)-dependent oxidoreductase [Ruminococcus sp.]|jgi:short-subunit dehydrogenase|nr:SDR family NAD(P)-dependent oxidoreductase [Ruminococcus sp.]
MIALITGASTGLGRDMAIYLSELGYDLILTARSKNKLVKLKKMLPSRVKIITTDLSKPENAIKLYDVCKNIKVDVLINNAGVGAVGAFDNTSLDEELNLINLNVTSLHILTKLFYRDFKRRNHGKILNVSSSAAFFPGPLMAAYYASKNYVLNLSQSIYREIKETKSAVTISVLCPGPVQTNFNKRLGVSNSFSPANSYEVSRYAIDMMLKGAFCIVPKLNMKISVACAPFLPANLKSKIIYTIQKRKMPL